MIEFVLIFISVVLLFVKTNSRTENDERRMYEAGQPKLIQGILKGDFSLFREGIAGGGSVTEIFEPFLGELELKLGKAHVDFPICPPLHFAFNLGTKDQLPIAEFLIRNGIDPNDYQLPVEPYNLLQRGYPPAILFGLGFGQRPTSSHAGFIQRLYLTHPKLLNLDKIPAFLQQTGNPPLLHITTTLGNFDGTLLLISQLNVSVNQIDPTHLITPLHIASWYGDIETAILLLHNGANPLAEDRAGHLPIHFALFRGQVGMLSIFFSFLLEKNDQFDNSKLGLFRQILFHRDKLGRNLLDFLFSPPYHRGVFQLLRTIRTNLDCSMEDVFEMEKQFEVEEEQKQKLDVQFGQWKLFVASETSQQETFQSLPPSSFVFNSAEEAAKSPLSLVLSHFSSSSSIATVQVSKSFTRLEFTRQYFSIQKPVLLQGQIARGQGIWAYLQNQLDFLDRYGSLSVVTNDWVYERYVYHQYCYPPYLASKYGAGREKDYEEECFRARDSRKRRRMEEDPDDTFTIDDFYLQVRSSPSSSSSIPFVQEESKRIAQAKIYPAQYHQQWFTDFRRPMLFDLCGNKDQEAFKLTLSSEEAISPLHFHNATWNLLLQGKKLWIFLPPAILSNQTFFQQIATQTAITKKQLLSSLFSLNELSRVLPFMIDAFSWTIQSPEDVVFVPDLWGHIVVALEDSISLSQEICTMRHSDMRIQPLGSIIYAGNDDFRGYGSFKLHERTNIHAKREFKSDRSKIPDFERSFVV